LPGHTTDDIRAMLEEAIGDLGDRCEIVFAFDQLASASPTGSPLWDVLSRRAGELVPGANVVPFLLPGATDARYLRRLGAICYGFGLYTERIPFDDFAAMFHGDDERIDIGSLDLTTQLWLRVVRDLLE
jgi:acetylornithine deacetylase/succinyl-diaminopimelate desuccinylase-like protein